jgi:hypothetical protein
MKKQARIFLGFLLILAGTLSSCGIDEYAYLDPAPVGNIQSSFQDRAVIQLPTVGAGYFTHFTIFYRIYISDFQAPPGTIPSNILNLINPALASDYNYLAPYTNADSAISTATASVFRNCSYQILFYNAGGSIVSDVLSRSPPWNAEGKTVILEFPVDGSRPPDITLDGTRYALNRSTGSGSYHPQPDRYFFNTNQLNSSANANATTNGDVANNTAAGSPRYTYTAMYIVSTGIDESTYTPIYSIPTFIGIFRLPDRG